ncbi:uncharacterized protein VP01_1016g2 [Puccinia sorghi]|uniref:Uncharacterized protein n=1 Tax=Puccinia sorghi TaxID=27349 RepID=A0A0L6VV05_9BASI|nr:uncharacterized protein VP01_1016g2 [Puccinia sorghi]
MAESKSIEEDAPPNPTVSDAAKQWLAQLTKGKALDKSGGDDEVPRETNYQPLITNGQATGSSPANWRRAKTPPHVVSTSDMAMLIAEMKAQREDDQLWRQREESRAQRKADLEEQSRVTAIVTAVSKRFGESDILKPDGSNLRQWELLLRLRASERFGNPNFYTPEDGQEVNPAKEKIGGDIINASVHTDLTYDLLDLPSAAEIFARWLNFIRIDPAKHDTTASLHEAFSNAAKTFCEQGMVLDWDEMIGLIIQANLRDGLRQALNKKIDLFMEAHDNQIPSSQDVLRFLDAAKTEQKLDDSSQQIRILKFLLWRNQHGVTSVKTQTTSPRTVHTKDGASQTTLPLDALFNRLKAIRLARSLTIMINPPISDHYNLHQANHNYPATRQLTRQNSHSPPVKPRPSKPKHSVATSWQTKRASPTPLKMRTFPLNHPWTDSTCMSCQLTVVDKTILGNFDIINQISSSGKIFLRSL